VGANGKIVPVWGRRRQVFSFAGHDLEFDFYLAAFATPIIGMDFLAKFELSIIPKAKQQVLHAALTSDRGVHLLPVGRPLQPAQHPAQPDHCLPPAV
jgi:hypothetical protein